MFQRCRKRKQYNARINRAESIYELSQVVDKNQDDSAPVE
jgi:hypothetical protein